MENEKASSTFKGRRRKKNSNNKKININNPDDESFICIDVECVATGRGHLDRTPVSVGIVNYEEEALRYELIQPTARVYSYLTDMTGFDALKLEGCRSLVEVRNDIFQFLGPKVVLVGQGIQNDIRWLELQKGVHYKRFVDLAPIFASTFNDKVRGKQTRSFPLQHVAKQLLGEDYILTGDNVHSALTDAQYSIKLFKQFCQPDQAKALVQAKHKLHQGRGPEKRVLNNGDVCCSAYNPNGCSCGQPSLQTILANPSAFTYPYPIATGEIHSSATTAVSVHAAGVAAGVAAAAVNVTPSVLMFSHHKQTKPVAAARKQVHTYSNSVSHSYSRFTMAEAHSRGCFDPQENYIDDHDNLYGDFYGNYGGRDG